MSEILLDPEDFQSQIDAFEEGTEKIEPLKYSMDKGDVKLCCVDKYEKCVKKFNETLALFAEMMGSDTESMKLIKATWMNLDGEIATKTLGEVLFGDED